MHLCFFAEGYPTDEDPFMPFVREYVAEFARQGVRCSVIAPQSLTRALAHRRRLRPRQWTDAVEGTAGIEVYQPAYVSLSGHLNSLRLKNMAAAAKRAFRRIREPVDALYAHFWHMGVVASGLPGGLPLFVACGESRIEVQDDFGTKEIGHMLDRLTGVVYVGTKSLHESEKLGLQKDKPYIIAPNGYNEAQFATMERGQCRKELGWPEDDYVVTFVGTFNPRKGVLRLAEALRNLNDDTKACFIGAGELQPEYGHSLYTGKLAHTEIVKYLNASDVFVLPTYNEGCCNAIVEALACGLPVISSNQEFNDDILDDDCSIRIDPMDIEALSRAIAALRDPAERTRLADGAKRKAAGLSLRKRVENITQFIQTQI